VTIPGSPSPSVVPVRRPGQQPPRALLVRDEASGYLDLSLKGDLAESWQGSPDQRVWTFKIRRGVKWHNVPPSRGASSPAATSK